MQAVKVVVNAPFNAGKSQLIAAASEIELVRTERWIADDTAAVKLLTTALLDYDWPAMLPGGTLHLYNTPGQGHFDVMWQALARRVHGLLLVDSADPATLNEG